VRRKKRGIWWWELSPEAPVGEHERIPRQTTEKKLKGQQGITDITMHTQGDTGKCKKKIAKSQNLQGGIQVGVKLNGKETAKERSGQSQRGAR